QGLLREFSGFEYGKTVRLRGTTWNVVGVFEAPGTVFESELWADVAVTQSLFNRPNVFQTMRVQLQGPRDVARFKAWAKSDARLQGVEVLTEREYLRARRRNRRGNSRSSPGGWGYSWRSARSPAR